MADRAQGKLDDWVLIPGHVTSAPVKLSSVDLVTNVQVSDRKSPEVILMAGENGIHRATGSFVNCNYEGRKEFSLIKDASTFKVSPKYFTATPVHHPAWTKIDPMANVQGHLSCQPSSTEKCEFNLFPINCSGELKVIGDRLAEANALAQIAQQNYLKNHAPPRAGDVIRDPEPSRATQKAGMLQWEYQNKETQCKQ